MHHLRNTHTHTRQNTPLSYSSRGVLMADKVRRREKRGQRLRVKSRVQSCDSFSSSSLNIICIWPFECPLVLLQATAHHSTAAPPDNSRWLSPIKLHPPPLDPLFELQARRARTIQFKQKYFCNPKSLSYKCADFYLSVAKEDELNYLEHLV